MCSLFPCIPIFRGVFLLKVQKECVYVIMLKIALVLVKNVFFDLKKGISRLLHWVAKRNTALFIYFKHKCYANHRVTNSPLGRTENRPLN